MSIYALKKGEKEIYMVYFERTMLSWLLCERQEAGSEGQRVTEKKMKILSLESFWCSTRTLWKTLRWLFWTFWVDKQHCESVFYSKSSTTKYECVHYLSTTWYYLICDWCWQMIPSQLQHHCSDRYSWLFTDPLVSLSTPDGSPS